MRRQDGRNCWNGIGPGSAGPAVLRAISAFAFASNDVDSPANTESIDVNAQVEAGVAAVRIPKHVDLVMDLAPGLPNIPCTALDLVVENLLLNAVKAIKDQPGSLRVTSTLDQRLLREPFIVITVQDTGCGMEEATKNRVFEPFSPRKRLVKGPAWGLPRCMGS